jgi:methanogenic corrinoid protein MtbC1
MEIVTAGWKPTQRYVPRMRHSNPHASNTTSEYVLTLLEGEIEECRRIVREQVFDGQSWMAFWNRVAEPALLRLAARRESGRVSEAVLQTATRITRTVLTEQASAITAGSARHAPSVIVTTAPGNQHDWGAFVLACLLRFQGWNVVEIEPLRCDGMADQIRRENPAFVALSAATPSHVRSAVVLTRELRATGYEFPILVGGSVYQRHAPFGYVEVVECMGKAEEWLPTLSIL